MFQILSHTETLTRRVSSKKVRSKRKKRIYCKRLYLCVISFALYVRLHFPFRFLFNHHSQKFPSFFLLFLALSRLKLRYYFSIGFYAFFRRIDRNQYQSTISSTKTTTTTLFVLHLVTY